MEITILAIADKRPQESIKEVVKQNQIDLICTLGDLDKVEIQELAAIESIPKLGVYGNHCSGTYMDPLGITNMHLNVFELNRVTFGGFEGSVKYKESSWAKMYTQEEAVELLKNFQKVDVMLTHAPPFGINDEPEDPAHTGFKGLKSYVESKKPQYLLHGHTYPTRDQLATNFNETKIIYVNGMQIVTLTF